MNLKLSDNNLNMDTKSDVMGQENIQNESARYQELQNDDWMKQFEEEPYVAKVEEPERKSVKEMSFKDKILLGFGFLMLVGISAWCLISGMKGMFLAPVHPMDDAFVNLVEGDVYEGAISYISPEVGELKHTINFIPAGTEHFYLMFSEDGTKAIPIRVPKEWDTQFIDNSVMEVSLQERGIVREMDHQVRSELMSSITTSLEAAGMDVERVLYIDLNTNKLSILQIFTGLSLILCSMYLAIVVKRSEGKKEKQKSVMMSFVSIVLFVTALILIYLLNMV